MWICICICSEVVLLIRALCKVVYFWQWQETGGDLLQRKMWPTVTGHTRAFHKSLLMVKGKIHQYFGLPFPWSLMRSWRLFLPSNLKPTIGSNLLVCFQVCPSLWISEGFKVTTNLSALRKKTNKDSSGYTKHPPLFTTSAEWAQPEMSCLSPRSTRCDTNTESQASFASPGVRKKEIALEKTDWWNSTPIHPRYLALLWEVVLHTHLHTCTHRLMASSCSRGKSETGTEKDLGFSRPEGTSGRRSGSLVPVWHRKGNF